MIRLIEELSMNAWPALQTSLYDGWVLRVSNGYTKRANSVNPLYKTSLDLDEKIEYCKRFYDNLRLPTVYKITPNPELAQLDRKLAELGYSRLDETSVRVLDLAIYNANDNSSTMANYKLTEEWVEGYIRSSRIENQSMKSTLESMLKNIIGKTMWITHKVDGKAVGFGFGVVDNGYVGIFDIYVNGHFRGKGYGKAVMNKILSEAKELGVEKAYLQVVVGNTVAENLYQQLGFEEKYRYWYRRL